MCLYVLCVCMHALLFMCVHVILFWLKKLNEGTQKVQLICILVTMAKTSSLAPISYINGGEVVCQNLYLCNVPWKSMLDNAR